MSSSDCIVTELDTNFIGGESSSNIKDEKAESDQTDEKDELQKLIFILKNGIKNNEPGIKYIKYPDLLVDALEKLNATIGMHRLKESVAIQTVRLIENLKLGEKSPKMLNTVLYGNPGTGKTHSGILLAKIWFALGFLSPNSDSEKITVKKETKNVMNTPELDTNNLILLFFLFFGTYILQFLAYVNNKIGFFWLALALGFVLLVIIILYWSEQKSGWITKYVTEWKTKISEKDVSKLQDRDIITVVSRNDFVGEYLGHTSGKTKKLLEANLGKVLFIDEAYSLLNDARDSYGYEALNTLNLFLSENADKIVVIFAGYKEQMKNSIFLAQPGLERRCMWSFHCDNYSGEELAEIFLLMAEKDKWKISDWEKVKKLICRNESIFKNMAGDCERLLYLSSLEASRNGLNGISKSFLSNNTSEFVSQKSEKCLTYKNIEIGLLYLRENRFD